MDSDFADKISATVKELTVSGECKQAIPGYEKIFVFSDIGETRNHQLIGTMSFKGNVFFVAQQL